MQTDPYWIDDVLAGEMPLRDGVSLVRLKIHRSAEAYPAHYEELLPIDPAPGVREYVHAKPYLLVPDITLTVGLYPQIAEAGAIGEVVASTWEGMRHQEIGNVQAWYYRSDHLLMIWELEIYQRWRTALHAVDELALVAAWRSFETYLLGQFPATQRIVTPAWEPNYPDDWQAFLLLLGFAPAAEPAIFAKYPAAA